MRVVRWGRLAASWPRSSCSRSSWSGSSSPAPPTGSRPASRSRAPRSPTFAPAAEDRLAARAERWRPSRCPSPSAMTSLRTTAEELGVTVDWKETVARARDAGAFPPPFRGIKRIVLRFFGTDVQPVASAYDAGLTYELDRVAAAVEQSPRDATIELEGKTARSSRRRPESSSTSRRPERRSSRLWPASRASRSSCPWRDRSRRC